MLGIVGHRDRLVDQKHGDAVLDAVRAAQPRVVEEFLMAGVDQKQWPAVLRADQDAQQFVVEHDGWLADADEDARVLARLYRNARGYRRAHPRRGPADTQVVAGLLGVARVLLERLQLALVGQRVLQCLD